MVVHLKIAATILGPLGAALAATGTNEAAGVPAWAYIVGAVIASGAIFRVWLLRPEKDSVIAKASEQAVAATHVALEDVRTQLNDTRRQLDQTRVELADGRAARAALHERVEGLMRENTSLRFLEERAQKALSDLKATHAADVAELKAQMAALEQRVGGRRSSDDQPR